MATSKRSAEQLRVAIVHDWLTNIGGAERVVESLLRAFPQADIYSSVYSEDKLPQFKGRVKTSFLQHWPWAQRKHQLYPVLRTLAFESFDFSGYDLVISSSSAEAKGIITSTETLHISYIHTPVRYYWSNYDDYLADPGFGALNPLIRLIAPSFVRRMRYWDFAAAQRPDVLLANSENVAKRIEKYYKRSADVVHPPVDTDRFKLEGSSDKDYYLIVSRLVPYKRVDVAVEACTRLGRRLIVAGGGSELKRLKKMAGPTIDFRGGQSNVEITRLYQGAKALLFPGEEDFGITPLEAMACGKPVLAYGRGGATETVVDGVTGVLFSTQTPDSLAKAIKQSEVVVWDSKQITRHAHAFSEERFIKQIQDVVTAHVST